MHIWQLVGERGRPRPPCPASRRAHHSAFLFRKTAGAPAVPGDMSDPSLIGGGLITGDSLAPLCRGICLLLATLWGK